MMIKISMVVAAVLAATSASAVSTSFTGNLAHDNSLVRVAFHVGTTGVVNLTSLGFAGGVNAAGQTIAAGGFDTLLSLYDWTGTGIAFNDDGANAATDPTTGLAADAQLSVTLTPGTYSVYLTQVGNDGPLLLSNGFPFVGVPDYAGGFVDYGNQRDSHYALDITGAGVVSAPEASSVAALLGGLGLLGFAARRRRAV